MRDSRLRTLAAAVLSVVLLVALASAASASLQTTGVLHAWDDGQNGWQNGNLGMLLNNIPEPFYAQMDWDAKPHADACGTGTSSIWSGDAVIGLYHQDLPQYAPPYDPTKPINGFVSSQNWKIVKCSALTTNPKNPPVFAPGDILAECVFDAVGSAADKGCIIMANPTEVTKPYTNLPVPCTTGNCAWEIETKFHINTDLNCDNIQDGATDPVNYAGAGDLCVYWEGTKPDRNTRPLWNGNIQVRYGTGQGGDKTINFKVLTSPNAVGLRAFSGTSTFNLLPIGLGVVVAALGGLALGWRAIELRRKVK